MSSAADEALVLPGRAIGVFGGGQLGRMLGLVAKRLGYQFHVFSDVPNSPAGQVADSETVADFLDEDAVARFARQAHVITLEFENVPTRAVQVASRFAPVRPGPRVLETAQDRWQEKSFLATHGFPVTPFRKISSLNDLQDACQQTVPAVLKTTTDGYDGKGQFMIRNAEQLHEAWQMLGGRELILEDFVEFDCELSVVAARNAAGVFQAFDPIRNHHHNHILDISISPANLPKQVCDRAVEVVRGIMEALDAVGVICVEFFLRAGGDLVVNEIAPRPHNSGHLTIDAHETSQFEQQLRAICGLKPGSTHQNRPAAMVNLLGECWQSGQPDWNAVLTLPGVHLHLYGKSNPRAGRKMGHIVATADTAELATERAIAARKLLNANQPIADSGHPAR